MLHFTIREDMSDTQVIHQLLSQLGIKIERHWSRSVEGHEGEKLRVWELDRMHWEQVEAVLERRQAKRQQIAQKQSGGAGSSVGLNDQKQAGDPATLEQSWLSPESLAEVREWIELSKVSTADRAWVKSVVPEFVLRHLGVLR